VKVVLGGLGGHESSTFSPNSIADVEAHGRELAAEIEKSSTHEFELAGQHIDPVQLDSSLIYIPGKS
jgi:hypothetical protein